MVRPLQHILTWADEFSMNFEGACIPFGQAGAQLPGQRSGTLETIAFHLQRAAFSKWAMLGSNQRPPPCKGGALPLS
jgi:hypothetical protein